MGDKDLINYQIGSKQRITRGEETIYDMYNVTLYFKDGSQKNVKIFTEPDSYDFGNSSLIKNQIIDRLIEQMNSGKKDDLFFLGKLVNENSSSRYYEVPNTGMNAQDYFDKMMLPKLKELFKKNDKKTLYSEITSPFDDPETVKKLVDVYANNDIKSTNNLYFSLIESRKNENDNRDIYYNEFINNVFIPNMERFYKRFKENDAYNLFNDQSVSMVFDHFDNFKDLWNYVKETNAEELGNIEKSSNYKDKYEWAKEEYIKKLKQYQAVHSLSDKQLKTRLASVHTLNKLRLIFDGGIGVMGFHVNPQRLYEPGSNIPLKNTEIKFYINAGPDTYKVAKYFQNMCHENKKNYYYKVVNPEKFEGTGKRIRYEDERDDKMCIYSTLDDALIFLEMLEKIKQEHPEIHYRKPPLLTGTLNGYIGIGTDKIDKDYGSYNGAMSKICFEVLKDEFKSIPKEQIKSYVKLHPEILEEIKSQIVFRAKQIGLSEEKICVKSSDKSKLENIELVSSSKKYQNRQENGYYNENNLQNTQNRKTNASLNENEYDDDER